NPGLREINQWQYFPTCVKGTFDGADRPAIAFDTAGKTLWAAQGGPIAGMQLFVFQNCGAGSPGTSPCPMTKSIDVLGAVGHPGVAFDPCTHLGMLTYRTGDLAHLRFYKPDGTMVQDLALDVANEVPPQTNQGAWYQSTSCVGQNGYAPKCNQPAGACTGGQGCLRLASKIQIATQVLGGQCFAYLAYDISRLSRTDNKTYLHAALDVVNTTTAGAAVQVTGLRIGNDFVTWDSFGSNVAAADTPTASGAFPAGWYFYQEGGVTTQTDDPCHTYFEGIITTDHFVSTTYVQIAPVTFPAVAFPQYDGMGDYQGTLTRGLPQGILFPTWVQSVPMSSGSCVSCMGAQYSAGIYATRLHVP
ncbi:MAG TPA: hypothetical protein VFT91_09595, partial [Dehalococcoidia bacterium]|nr:hypothetical protein [Dehalococcoidia bacterium]